ncbi:MAG TPA: LPS export ABC transporter periplasmic protein LptC [Devosia sp.]|nr:LPS export ABC transporter periplasmic protein LptC [Devosia sp.]
MVALARTDTLEQRTAILGRLTRHNRIVGILRYGVPALGIVIFGALALQIFLGNLLQQYDISGFSIDRGNLVVETPGFTAVGDDGTLYRMRAERARAALDHPEQLLLTTPTITASQQGRPAYHAVAAEATLDTGTQMLTVPGVTDIASDDGMSGRVDGLVADLGRKSMTSDGAVNMTFADGTTLAATGMSFDSEGRVWTFGAATLVLPDLPDGDAP